MLGTIRAVIDRWARNDKRQKALTQFRQTLAAALYLLLTLAAPARGEDQPLWEAGLGFTVLDFPDYRGSDERTTYVLPVPYAIYRGKLLRIERDRARGIFFERRRISLQISVSGSVPVDSSGNAARQGMPDLDPTFEFGPSFDLLLFENEDSDFKIDLRFPVRTVIATDLRSFNNVGWVFEPRINFNWSKALPSKKWNLGIAAGPVFGDKRYHNYFYGVAPEFATAERPAYVAESGYGGTQATGSVSRRYGRMWVGGFLRWDSVFEAVFDASPLVRQEETLTAGIAIVWRLNESKRRVPADD
ncbi:MAG: MipA/OmpV family protein [Betaproteobacteria bacterium]|nr:MAG: MipA/OmpV family protein [Betaproteobacteria bacterium]